MEAGSNFKESMKENVTFATVKGVFLGAITGVIGVSFANLVTSKIDSTAKDQNFTDVFSKRSKSSLPYAAIVGAVAGAVYYNKSAKYYNKAIEGKWTVKISEEEKSKRTKETKLV